MDVERQADTLRKLLREEGALPLSLVASGNETYARDVRARFEPSEMGEFEEAWAEAQTLATEVLSNLAGKLPAGFTRSNRGGVWAK